MSCKASCTGLSPAVADLSRSFQSLFQDRLIRVRSPLLTESLIDVLSSGYLDVSVPRVCPYSPMYSGISTCPCPLMVTPRLAPRRYNNKHSGGFPHSEISGSKPVPGSPKLNAGYHVLHRLLLPRHPPNALFALDLIRKEQGRRIAPAHRLPVSKAVLSHLPSAHAGRQDG
jgi:hypothetical protein